jgi:hypothetical protein
LNGKVNVTSPDSRETTTADRPSAEPCHPDGASEVRRVDPGGVADAGCEDRRESRHCHVFLVKGGRDGLPPSDFGRCTLTSSRPEISAANRPLDTPQSLSAREVVRELLMVRSVCHTPDFLLMGPESGLPVTVPAGPHDSGLLSCPPRPAAACQVRKCGHRAATVGRCCRFGRAEALLGGQPIGCRVL